jgi:RNA polymerase-interacting CarD/CdnL/TRCF family regulator
VEFQIGEKVVHSIYGPGEIIQIDEKYLSGHTTQYYAVQINDLTLYVPVDDSHQSSLRQPTPAKEFKKLYAILRSPGDPLSTDRFERKVYLTESLKDGSLESICRVIRDLSYYRHSKKLSDSDNTILERAERCLVSEWVLSLAIPVAQAEQELHRLLRESLPNLS